MNIVGKEFVLLLAIQCAQKDNSQLIFNIQTDKLYI